MEKKMVAKVINELKWTYQYSVPLVVISGHS